MQGIFHFSLKLETWCVVSTLCKHETVGKAYMCNFCHLIQRKLENMKCRRTWTVDFNTKLSLCQKRTLEHLQLENKRLQLEKDVWKRKALLLEEQLSELQPWTVFVQPSLKILEHQDNIELINLFVELLNTSKLTSEHFIFNLISTQLKALAQVSLRF